MISDTVWADILSHLRSHHPDLVRGWFGQLSPGRLSNGELEVQAPTPQQQRYLSEHCRHAFVESSQAATGHLVGVRFCLAPAPEAAGPGPDPLPLAFEQETDELTLNTDYVFDHFITGPSNRLSHAACLAISEAPGQTYNPLFIHGPVGMGKTHLLQATCWAVRENQPDARILFLSCETFANHFIEAVERGALHSFRYRYRHVDVLVIDDIQFLAERERSQEEFFHTFNTLYQAQKQIILSADSPPGELPSLEQRLVSRFNWGLVARIDPPCLETRMAIIRKKARLRGLDLDEDTIHHIASHVATNIRELEGAIVRLVGISHLEGQSPSLELARRALGELQPPRQGDISIQEILDAVMRRCNVRLADLQSRKRNKSIAFPRQVCMYLARELTRHSLAEIGGYFGGRDHTTVLHAARTIDAQRQRDGELDRMLTQVASELRSRG